MFVLAFSFEVWLFQYPIWAEECPILSSVLKKTGEEEPI